MRIKKPWEVTLSWPEQLHAATIGAQRRISARAKGRVEPFGPPDSPWESDIEGAGAELAVAKATGKYWSSIAPGNDKLVGDVQDIQVRWTTHEAGKLIVYPDDQDEQPFVLVRGRLPVYLLEGWIRGVEAKKGKYRTTLRREKEAFMVPSADLNDIQELFTR